MAGRHCSCQPTRRSHPMLMSSNLFTSSVQPLKGGENALPRRKRCGKKRTESAEKSPAFSPTFHHYHRPKLLFVSLQSQKGLNFIRLHLLWIWLYFYTKSVLMNLRIHYSFLFNRPIWLYVNWCKLAIHSFKIIHLKIINDRFNY